MTLIPFQNKISFTPLQIKSIQMRLLDIAYISQEIGLAFHPYQSFCICSIITETQYSWTNGKVDKTGQNILL